MNINDETLSAFLDAELPEPEMQAIREHLRTDPTLTDRLAKLAAVDSQLFRHYSTIDDEPLPSAVTDALAKAGSSASATPAPDNVVAFRRWRSLQQSVRQHAGLAVAAVLVLTLAVAKLFDGAANPSWPVVTAGLETAPSGQPVELSDGRTLTPRLTFRNQRGDYCREFHLQGAGHASERIACRSGERWTLAAQAGVEPSPGDSGYHTASGGSALDPVLDQMMSGDAIGPAEERRLIDSGWEKR
ncbi:MAG: hypothetical protein R3303_14890 [Marinobacter sp.]|nr:hypothetical protein [Marinobacter sp.]